VVYLNGTEVARDNMPAGAVTYSTAALGGVGDANERTPARFQVPRALLVAGANTLAVEIHQSDADSNDLGFMRRADERTQGNWIQLRNFTPGTYVRTRNINFNQYSGWNFGGDRLYLGSNINTHWTFTNYFNIGAGFNLDAAPFRDRVTRGGPGVLGNPGKNLWFSSTPTTARPSSSTTTAASGPTPAAARGATSAPASTGAPARRSRST